MRKLDVGYGYTADKGETFPFRGKGVGLLASIDEVFEVFTGKELLIHIKNGRKEAAQLPVEYFYEMDDDQLNRIYRQMKKYNIGKETRVG
ncbi:MAG: hypothetical protein PHW73_03255 [Atribacterota bacterium]|nr:hypothetical protein [Atribacterota bacterium]